MSSRFPLHPKLTIVIILAVFMSAFSSVVPAGQEVPGPTPDYPPGFRGIQPPIPGIGSSRGASAEGLSSEPEFGLLYANAFESSELDPSAWLDDPSWSLAPGRRGQALQIFNNGQRFEFVADYLDDMVASVQLQINSRAAELRLRESEAGFYAVRLVKRGEVQLRRGDEILATAPIPEIKQGKWRKVRVSIIDDTIRVMVKGTEVITFQDPNPLPEGSFGVIKRGASTSSLLVDDVKVWLPRIDMPWMWTEEEKAAFETRAIQTRVVYDIASGDVADLIAKLQTANPTSGSCPVGTTIINLATNGNYTLTQAYAANTLGGSNGLPRIRCTVTINGNGSTIQRVATNKFRILIVSGLSGSSQALLTLTNITLRGGEATAQGGSGINVSTYGRADIIDSTITANTLTGTNLMYGAGIRSMSLLNLTNSIVSNNQSLIQNSVGAGIAVDGGSTTLSNTRVEGNSLSPWGAGGGISGNGVFSITIGSNSQIINNTSTGSGAGLYLTAYSNSSSLVSINEAVISGNISNYYGGGIYHNFGGTVTVFNSIFANNASTAMAQQGGAIYAISSFSIANSCIQGNSSLGVVRAGTTGTLSAVSNWWGAANGPSGAGPGSGDSIGANVSFDSFQTSQPAFCVPAILDDNCGDSKIDLIRWGDYPQIIVQEAKDMQIADSIGVHVLSAPIWNAKRTGNYFIWGSRIKVYKRAEFPQTGFSNQVWYQVGTHYGTSALGWIVARLEDRSYVAGNNPCTAVSSLSETDALTFLYNRQRVLTYASQHAYQNNLSPIPPAEYRVTKRLNSNPFNLPFANFVYSDLGIPGTESTGSALFVSESIWMGGFPMSVGDPNSCAASLYNESGWRYCPIVPSSGGSTSTPWEVHKALGEYYTTAHIIEPGWLTTNEVLVYGGYPNQGSQRMFVQNASYPITNNDRVVEADIEPYIGDVTLGGDDPAFNPTGIAGFSAAHLNSLKAGDYVWINSFDPANNPPGSPHGLIIVGWRAPITCSSAITSVFTDFSITSVPGTVPYVADSTSVQSPIPRPFYCTAYNQPAQVNFLLHSWRFYRLADQIILPVDVQAPTDAQRVYVPDNWQWGATDGQ